MWRLRKNIRPCLVLVKARKDDCVGSALSGYVETIGVPFRRQYLGSHTHSPCIKPPHILCSWHEGTASASTITGAAVFWKQTFGLIITTTPARLPEQGKQLDGRRGPHAEPLEMSFLPLSVRPYLFRSISPLAQRHLPLSSIPGEASAIPA